MPETKQTVAISPVQRYWWAEAWSGARPRFIATAAETIASAALLLGLAVFYLVLRLLAVAGVPDEEITSLKHVDFWAIYAVFATFSFGFVLQSISGVITQRKNLVKGQS